MAKKMFFDATNTKKVKLYFNANNTKKVKNIFIFIIFATSRDIARGS